MELENLSTNPTVKQIINHPDDDTKQWHSDFQRFISGDDSITRRSVGEAGIRAIQRLLIFLGYSTSAGGSFSIDGDFGRGTNRGLAQFKHEHGLSSKSLRKQLCYPCTWNTSRSRITIIPDVKLTKPTLKKMLKIALERSKSGHVICGDFNEAIFHLNALDKHQYLSCKQILTRYGEFAQHASEKIGKRSGKLMQPEWILAIIRQETAGIIRPRFEQHYLSRLNKNYPNLRLEELRMRSMSLGLGQIMGENYKRVGAGNPLDLFTAPVPKQVGFVAEFLSRKSSIVTKTKPKAADFREIARYYNGPGYEKHHYHEQLERWYREFVNLRWFNQ